MKMPVELRCLLLGAMLCCVFLLKGIASDAVAKSETPSDYQLRANDMIAVTVYQQDDFATTTRISASGSVKLPLIGSITVAGLTPEEAAEEIEKKLAKQFIVNPQATVTVTDFAKRNFTVLGEVKQPGVYGIPPLEEVSLLEAIGLANGYTPMANMSDIRVKRKESGKWVIYRFNGKKMAGDNTNFIVQPNDVVIVGERLL